MKLSDAMMFGSMIRKLDSSCWDGCLLGISAAAAGAETNKDNRAACRLWPWIEDTPVTIPFVDYGRASFPVAISYLSREVEIGHITIGQVVDWVRSVEPLEGMLSAVVDEDLLMMEIES